MTKRWTKTDVKQMRFALDWAMKSNAPIAGAFGLRPGEREEFVARFRDWLLTRRTAIVLAHFRSLAGLVRDRVEDHRRTADHARSNPTIWGKATDEIVERFDRLAKEDAAGLARLDRLISRVNAEGLPPEVEAYDPTST